MDTDGMIEVNGDGTVAQEGTEAPAQEQPRRDHHAQRQPREVGKFAGPPAPKEEKPAEQPAPPAKRKYTYTTDRATGKKAEVELGDEDIPNVLAKAHGFDRKAQEFAEFRKQVEQERAARETLTRELKEGKDRHVALRKFMNSTGLDDDAAHDTLVFALKDILEEKSLTPEQRELKALREEKAARAREAEEQEDKRAEEDFQREVETRREILAKDIKAAFAKAGQHGLPVNERALSVMGQYLIANAKEGIQATPEEVAQHWKDELTRDFGAVTKNMTGEQVREHFPHLYKAVHADLRARARPQQPAARPAPQQRPEPRRKADKPSGPVFYDTLA